METVLITGAARRLGRLIAEDLAANGCFVWIHYFTHDVQAEELCAQIIKNGGKANCVKADLASIEQIDNMISYIRNAQDGELTAIINNASVFPAGTVQRTEPMVWDRTMNTNLRAVWYLSSQLYNHFPSAKRVITIGDASAGNDMPQHAVYALSKYALKFLTEQMALSFAPRLRVNLLSPGLVLKGENEPESVWERRQSGTLFDNSDIISSILAGIRFLMQDHGMTGSELIIDNGFRFRSKA